MQKYGVWKDQNSPRSRANSKIHRRTDACNTRKLYIYLIVHGATDSCVVTERAHASTKPQTRTRGCKSASASHIIAVAPAGRAKAAPRLQTSPRKYRGHLAPATADQQQTPHQMPNSARAKRCRRRRNRREAAALRGGEKSVPRGGGRAAACRALARPRLGGASCAWLGPVAGRVRSRRRRLPWRTGR